MALFGEIGEDALVPRGVAGFQRLGARPLLNLVDGFAPYGDREVVTLPGLFEGRQCVGRFPELVADDTKIKGGFTYVWDQNTFDAITHDVTNFIHFEFQDGTKLKRAFRYDWRFWTMPELREVLEEAGFSKVHVYWDTSEDDEQDAYRLRTRAPNQPGWLAYLVAEL